ncbi:MAG: cyclopropane fatty acyl phospholipid synthase [Pseudomonadota bacterium]|nr:cyclopropane fatty acyl phospholipid synthase [Pseudomonadota bacterium]
MFNSAAQTLSRARSRVRTSLDTKSEQIVLEELAAADVRVDGSHPSDLLVHDPAFYTRLLRDGALGFGEAYMDGQWDCEALDELTVKLIEGKLVQKYRTSWGNLLHVLKARALNLQSTLRAFQVGERHYDIGNDLYQAMLGRRLAYTCAYWKDAETLDEAQEAKLDLVCRKANLQPGMKVLELGCGWGCFAQYAAEKYGVEVTGLTVSKAQVELGNHLCEGLPVELRLEDYRNATGAYDAVISIGIMEHVGNKNYRTYMEVADRCLKEDGVTVVHTIAGNLEGKDFNPWFDKYIFPNAVVPSLSQLARAAEGLFVIEDVHNIGPHYDPTLMAWYENFEQAWPKLKDKYGDRFYRMWRFYLLTAAGGFRARYQQLFQIVMTKEGQPQPACRLV